MPDVDRPAPGAQGTACRRSPAPPERPRSRRVPGRVCAALLASTSILAACAPRGEPETFAVPSAAAARIRLICPPDTFIGTMTANCPRPLPPAAAAR